ncbi:Protein R07A4.4 [Aphelenchoides avenae]|nr:Protein R07A4.4 [Aphelenchus avenae]
MADCLDLSRARVQLIDGIELTQQSLVVVQLSSPDECLHVCRLNAFMDGSRLPRACRSAVFDRSTGRCGISDSAISPNGELNYAPNQNSVYFEKTCIPESDLPMGCDDVFRRIPQVTLNPAAVGTGARHLGFNCRAASYYFETPDRNCYLSRFARDQRADIYMQDREKLVDYIEMPKCLKTDWQHDESPQSSEWSEWTECDQTMTKSRSRNCTRCSPKKETVECLSKPAFVQEFPKELEDVEKGMPITRLHKPSLNVKPLSERSLFGEQDYDHQEEVSFFGPPLAENSNGATECNPRMKCCPQPIGVRSVVRGCSVGFRIEADGSRVVCMPDSC